MCSTQVLRQALYVLHEFHLNVLKNFTSPTINNGNKSKTQELMKWIKKSAFRYTSKSSDPWSPPKIWTQQCTLVTSGLRTRGKQT